MTYGGINIGEAVQPIQDRVETYQSNGYAVINPGDSLSAGAYAVTVNSGNINASDTLSVGSSNDEIIFDGSTKSLSSATNIRINGVSAAGDGTEQYRYDVIYADNNGEVQKTEGSVTKLDSRESQNNLTRFERIKGAIPNPGTDPSVIIAAVIVNSNDTSVGTGQLRDYRVPAKQPTIITDKIDGGLTGNTTVSSIIGSGVEVVSGSLQAALGDGLDFASGNIQIVDSIYDAGNTEVTADVNNTNTTTNTLVAGNTFTSPGHTFLQAVDNQTISSGTTLSEVKFDSVGDDEFNLADTGNNAIQIPSNPDFNWLKISYTLQWNTDATSFTSEVFVDGNNWPTDSGRGSMGFDPGVRAGGAQNDTPTTATGWLDLTGDETIKLQVSQTSGSGVDLRSFATWMQAEVR